MTQLAQEVEGKGFNFVDWNLDSGDAGQLKSPTFDGKVQEEIRNVTSALSKTRGNVILMHDIKQTTANAIEEIVKFGKDNGYTSSNRVRRGPDRRRDPDVRRVHDQAARRQEEQEERSAEGHLRAGQEGGRALRHAQRED